MTECPKSAITAQSAAWLEEFAAWKLGGGDLMKMWCKSVDAIRVLEDEMRKETASGREKHP
jgi:hypothetical protein